MAPALGEPCPGGLGFVAPGARPRGGSRRRRGRPRFARRPVNPAVITLQLTGTMPQLAVPPSAGAAWRMESGVLLAVHRPPNARHARNVKTRRGPLASFTRRKRG